uniref:hypothetical protein n=1 Tax=Streptomyces sp. NBC_01562 TaxID=2975879 RepID=UPI002F91A4F4
MVVEPAFLTRFSVLPVSSYWYWVVSPVQVPVVVVAVRACRRAVSSQEVVVIGVPVFCFSVLRWPEAV